MASKKWRTADRQTLMSCWHDGVQRMVEPGETYRTISSVRWGQREVTWLCEECALGRSVLRHVQPPG